MRFAYRRIVWLQDWQNFGNVIMQECIRDIRAQVGSDTEPGKCETSYLRFSEELGEDGELHMVERHCNRENATHMSLDWRWQGATRDGA